jgi:hypothetical protein
MPLLSPRVSHGHPALKLRTEASAQPPETQHVPYDIRIYIIDAKRQTNVRNSIPPIATAYNTSIMSYEEAAEQFDILTCFADV